MIEGKYEIERGLVLKEEKGKDAGLRKAIRSGWEAFNSRTNFRWATNVR